MSREIKFRAWHKTEKRMDLVSFWDFVVGGLGFTGEETLSEEALEAQEEVPIRRALTDECELMQFTGLRDKNGQDIYEGDITKDSTGGCLIGWNDQLASFCLRRNGWAFDHFFGEAVDPSDVEVIGNIYENPELLKC